MKRLQHLINTPLSLEEIQKIMVSATGHETKILNVEDVKETDTMESLFSQFNDCVIYSPIANLYNGHFQCMFKDDINKIIYWFDSYGHNPSYLYKFVKQNYNRSDNNALYKILYRYSNGSKYKLVMNTIDYQSETSNAADCGRYATSVLIFHRKLKDFSFERYYDLITYYMKKMKLKNYDEAIVMLTEEFLK